MKTFDLALIGFGGVNRALAEIIDARAEGFSWLTNGARILRTHCVQGVTANGEQLVFERRLGLAG